MEVNNLNNNLNYFEDLLINKFCNATIIIDIDGTLLSDSSNDIKPNIKAKIQSLHKKNKIYLCSNSKNIQRNKIIAGKLGIKLITSLKKKLFGNISELILKDIQKNQIFVIGDKIITDGLLSRQLDGTFIKVRRITKQTDRLTVKLTYFFDDLIYALWRKCLKKS